MAPLVTVVITYNQEHYIRKAIDSVLAQKTDFDFEVYITEDCGTDGTRAILEEYAAQYPQRIRLNLREKNVGISRNWYEGLCAAKGEFVCTLEGDDWWRDESKLQKQADFLRAHPDYLAVSHTLLLTDDDLREEGRFKMNPPLRSREDREALIAGILDGTIEVIAPDPAPHTAEEKLRGLARSAMGIVGLECAFPLLYRYLVGRGIITLEQLIGLMAVNPRRIFGLGGGTEEGDAADFTVFDLEAEYRIDPATFRSKGRATPFAGWPVRGRTVLTVVGGREVYDYDNCKFK